MIRQPKPDWFVASDIAAYLGYANVSTMLNKVPLIYLKHSGRWLVRRPGALMLVPHLDGVLMYEAAAIREEFGIEPPDVVDALKKLRNLSALRRGGLLPPELHIASRLIDYFSSNDQVTSVDLRQMAQGHKPGVLLESVGVRLRRHGNVYTADLSEFGKLWSLL